MNRNWLDKAQPAKIGTIPMLVRVDGRSKIKEGNWIKVQYAENGNWEAVLVTLVQPNGHFFANK